MTIRTDSVLMFAIAGLAGVVFAITRGFWSAAPLLVIAGAGLVLQMMPPVPREQPGRVWWANANLVALGIALAATWYESLFMLGVGVLLVALTVAVPWLRRNEHKG